MLAYVFLLLVGAGSVVWAMGMIAHGDFITDDESVYLRQARRVALMFTALGMMWAAHAALGQNQLPDAPELLIVGGIDLYLVLAIVSAYRNSTVRRPRPKQLQVVRARH